MVRIGLEPKSLGKIQGSNLFKLPNQIIHAVRLLDDCGWCRNRTDVAD